MDYSQNPRNNPTKTRRLASMLIVVLSMASTSTWAGQPHGKKACSNVSQAAFYAPGIGFILSTDAETGDREELAEVITP